MRRRSVRVDSRAKQDLLDIYYTIALAGSPATGLAYIQRIDAFIQSLDLASERGPSLDEIDAGLRSIPFESVVIAVRVTDEDVIVARVFHASQNYLKQLRRETAASRRDRD